MTCPFPEYRQRKNCIRCPGMEDCSGDIDEPQPAADIDNPQPSRDSRDFFVYVANRLSGHPGEYLANVHELSAVCRRLMDAGYVVVNPAGDLLEGLMSGEVLPVQAYQRRSLGLLHLCFIANTAGHRAAMLVVNDTHRDGALSGGVHVEIDECRLHGLPVVWSDEELAELRGTEP